MHREMITSITSKTLTKIKENFAEPDSLSKYIFSHSSSYDSLDGSLSNGIPGLIILLSSFPEYFDENFIHNYMKEIGSLINNNSVDSLSLWTGMSGIAFATNYHIKNHANSYHNFLDDLNKLILDSTESYILSFKENIKKNQITSFDFDTIFGLSGIARYLLDCKLYKQSEVTKTIEDILTLFIELSYKDINNKAIMETDKTNRDSLLKKTKNGYLDTGLAHGLCGPLMILSIALEQGYELPNQRGAIEHSLEKLTKLANLDENSILNWSGKIEPSNNITSSDAMYGWCYGLPGIARTMWVSAQAIQSQLYMNYSLSLFKQLSTIPIKNLNIKAAPFCHGYSGLLTILYLMYLDTKDPDFQKFYNKLLSHIFDLYEESNLLSFCDYNHQNDRSLGVGLLEGTSGIILSINSITKNSYPQWAKAFLLF